MSEMNRTATQRNGLAYLLIAVIGLAAVTLASLTGLVVRDTIEGHLFAILVGAS